MKCKHCGAPLTGSFCEYCGCFQAPEQKTDKKEYSVTLGDKTFKYAVNKTSNGYPPQGQYGANPTNNGYGGFAPYPNPQAQQPVNNAYNYTPNYGNGYVPPVYGRTPPRVIATKKSRLILFILWLLGGFGICGFQRMYSGKVGLGILYLFTFGLFGIGAFIDFLLIVTGSMRDSFGNRI